jgi:hypothetical protein
MFEIQRNSNIGEMSHPMRAEQICAFVAEQKSAPPPVEIQPD